MTKAWEFRDNWPYLKRVPDDLSDAEDANGYQTSIIYDGQPINVTWFPERKGVSISGNADVDERVGKDAAVFGVVLIKLMRSGANCLNEL